MTTPYKLIGGMPLNEAENDKQIREIMEDDCLRMSRFCSIIVGVIVGIFIQASSLGTSLIMTTLYGKDIYLTQAFVIVSLAWCLVASAMGVAVMLLLRNLVVTAFYATNSSLQDEATLETKENFMLQVIGNMEQCFAIGSLVGVGSAWLVTDFLLKMESHACHSIVTVGIALLWCKFVMSYPTKMKAIDEKKSAMEPLLVGKEVIIAVV